MESEDVRSTCRIYIGGLGENATMIDLEGLFREYAPYSEATVLRGYAFIQFPSREAAERAIQGVNGRVFCGRKLTVKVANDNRQKRMNRQQKNNNKNQGNGPGHGRQGNNQNMGNRGAGGGNDDFQERDRSPMEDNRFNNNKNFNQSMNTNMPMGNQIQPSSLPAPEPDSNDCEIIVLSRNLTQYAENVESKLKRLGLSVDLLFPNEDVPIGKVLANIASRGTTYAVLVTLENESHNSITVNVLYGHLAEHRNMPIEDAVLFISKDFSEKRRREKASGFKNQKNNPVYDAPPLKDKHPEAIQHMINVLAANRQLTVLQYERLINYLGDRKEMQIKLELGDEADNVLSSKDSMMSQDRHNQNQAQIFQPVVRDTSKEDEEMLQRKIMDILNKPSITSVAEPEPEPVPIQQQPGNSGDFMHDPKVKKALDSLLSGSMFKF